MSVFSYRKVLVHSEANAQSGRPLAGATSTTGGTGRDRTGQVHRRCCSFVKLFVESQETHGRPPCPSHAFCGTQRRTPDQVPRLTWLEHIQSTRGAVHTLSNEKKNTRNKKQLQMRNRPRGRSHLLSGKLASRGSLPRRTGRPDGGGPARPPIPFLSK